MFRMPILTFDRLKKRRAGSTVMLLKKEQQHFDEHVEQPAMLVSCDGLQNGFQNLIYLVTNCTISF